MKAFYRKMVDRVVHPSLEKKLSLGRRSGLDRRQNENDRRRHVDNSILFSNDDRREGNDRRKLGVLEPRQKWFKINRSQSRHFSHDL